MLGSKFVDERESVLFRLQTLVIYSCDSDEFLTSIWLGHLALFYSNSLIINCQRNQRTNYLKTSSFKVNT